MPATTQLYQPRPAASALKILLFLGAISLANFYHYLLFHSIAEIFSVVVACATFMLAWNCRYYMRQHSIVYLGIGYVFVAVLEMFHVLSCMGMGMQHQDVNRTTQFWTAARLVEAITFVCAGLLAHRRLRPVSVFLFYALVMFAAIGLIFAGHFPTTVADGQVTQFKLLSEYATVLLFALSLLLFRRVRDVFERNVFVLLVLSIVLRMLAELDFAYHAPGYAESNLVGHMLKLAAFCLVYKAIIESGLRRPYGFLFESLRRSEDALRAANLNLRRRTEELERANEELDAFSHTVVHDLKRPLTSVQGFADLLAEQEAPRPSQCREWGERIGAAARRMGALIEDLLSLSQVKRGRLNEEAFDLAPLAREVADRVRETQPGREVDLEVEGGLVVRADPSLMRVVLENLLANAWKFTRTRAEARVTVRADDPPGPGMRTIVIQDNGVGFETRHAARLFRPFERLHRSDEYEGTGVGLATVRRIIERHGGTVWAHGASGEGAAFYFTVPASLAPADKSREGRAESTS